MRNQPPLTIKIVKPSEFESFLRRLEIPCDSQDCKYTDYVSNFYRLGSDRCLKGEIRYIFSMFDNMKRSDLLVKKTFQILS